MPTKSVKSTEKITSIRDVPSQSAHADSLAPHRKELDEFLFHEGTAHHAYTYLGAHAEPDEEGREKIIFRVWAPHAQDVSVVGSSGVTGVSTAGGSTSSCGGVSTVAAGAQEHKNTSNNARIIKRIDFFI